VQPVPAADLGATPARLRRSPVPALAVVAVAVALMAPVTLGGLSLLRRSGGGEPPAAPGLALVGGMPLQQARCAQWLAASPSERGRALDALHGVVGGPTPFGRASALTRPEAERLFDRACARPLAAGFLLYELYTRASGFRSLVTH